MEKWHQLVKKRIECPDMYVGRPSLENIACYLNGYLDCAHENGIELENDYNDFITFVWERYDNYTFAWYKLIQLYNPTEAKAFEAFKQLVAEFWSREQ